MKRISFFILSSLFFLNSQGQIPKSTLKDEKGIYKYTVDTLLSIILAKEKNINKVVITADQTILDQLPDVFSNIEIFKTDKFKGKRKFEGAIWIKMDSFSIKDSTGTVFTSIRKQINKSFPAWELKEQIGSYTLVYAYSKTGNYKLIDIKRGIFIH